MDKRYRSLFIGILILLLIAGVGLAVLPNFVRGRDSGAVSQGGNPDQESGKEESTDPEFAGQGTMDHDTEDGEAKEESGQKAPVSGPEELREYMVKIQAGTLAASGVILDVREDSVMICTAKHLVEESYESTVTFRDGRSGTAKSVYYSLQHDFAFLRVDAESNPDFDWKDLKGAPLPEEGKPEEIYEGQGIWIVASKTGAGEELENGKISKTSFFAQDFNDWLILVECEIRHGYSGGGVFTRNETLAGMVVGSDGEYGVCIPTEVILEEYRSEMEEK